MNDRKPEHPAKYNADLLIAIGNALDSFVIQTQHSNDVIRLLDPFGGVGGVHTLSDVSLLVDKAWDMVRTFSSELEFDWAKQSPGPMVQADVLALPFRPGSIDIVVTSPTYGNRMADHHDNQDPCSECKGTPEKLVQRVLWDNSILKEMIICKKCKGTGLSVRNTYRHKYGEPLRPESSATMQWGLEYRNFHAEAWEAVRDVLRIGGRFVLNNKNHIRDGEEQYVTEWHHDYITSMGCFELLDWTNVPVKGNGQGDNGKVRIDHESVIVYERIDD